MEDSCKPPGLTCEGLNIQDLNDQNISWVGAFDFDRSRKVMNATVVRNLQRQYIEIPKVYVQNIIGAVIVLDLAAGPIDAFNVHWLARLDCCKSRDIRMPTIMKMGLRIGGFVEIDFDGCADCRH